MINIITHKQKKRQRYNRFNYISSLKKKYKNKFYEKNTKIEDYNYSIFYDESRQECYIHVDTLAKYEMFMDYYYMVEIVKSHIEEEYRLKIKDVI